MVTPWCINLMLLPLAREDPEGAPFPGDTVERDLPSGAYDFLAARDKGIGLYLACSLLSPVDMIESQEQAREFAEAVLAEVTAVPEPPEPKAVSRRELLRGGPHGRRTVE
jgi:[NiFe] hydrogenase assembly HybE family chaperone